MGKIKGNFRTISKTFAIYHERNLWYELADNASTLTGPGKSNMYIVNTYTYTLHITTASKRNIGMLKYSKKLKTINPNITEYATLHK